MNLAIDFVNTNLASGTKTYNLKILRELDKKQLKKNVYIFVTKKFLIEFGKIRNPFIKVKVKPDFLSKPLFRLIWMQFFLPFELKYFKIDRLFSPMNICPIFVKFLKIKIYLGLHSNLPWVYFNLMPGNLFRNYLVKKMMEISINCCDTLLVNSFYAKNEIIKCLKLKKKIKVIYLGISDDFKKNIDFLNIQKKINFDQKYLLSVMSCVRYHNILNLLKAYNILLKENYDYKLILVMQILDKNYYKIIKEYVKKKKLENKVKIITNLPSTSLKYLYSKAKLYLFTSYSEVFGLTTLEAMSCGCLVVCSNRSALKEINKNCAIYFNPDNVEDIKLKIISGFNNNKLNNQIKKRAKEHIKKFSWKKTFDKTFEVLIK